MQTQRGGRRKTAPPKLAQTQTEDAYNCLKRAIIHGDLAEGLVLSEAEIRERFRISRTPFREACNRLHHERLLEVLPRRGYLVSKLSFRDVRDFFEARMMLESLAVQLAAERARPEQIAEMEDIVRRAKDSAGAPNSAELIIQLNTEFHKCILRATQNAELERLLSDVLDKRERLAHIERRYNRYQPSDFERAHRPILEAIADHDPVRARAKLIADIAEAELHILGQNASGAPAAGRLSNPELEWSPTAARPSAPEG